MFSQNIHCPCRLCFNQDHQFSTTFDPLAYTYTLKTNTIISASADIYSCTETFANGTGYNIAAQFKSTTPLQATGHQARNTAEQRGM